MQFVMKYIRKNLKIYIIAIIFMLFGITLDMLNPLLTRRIIDNVIKDGQLALLTSTLLMLLGVTLGRAVCGYTREYLFDKASVSVASDMRKDVFQHLNTLSMNFFDKKNTGELMSRIKEDIDNIWNACGFCIMLMIEQCFYILLPTILLFTLSWKLTLLYLVFLPIILFFAFRLEKKLQKTFEKISDQAAKLNTTAQENIAGVRLIRSFARETHEQEKFTKENETNYNLNYEQNHVWSNFYPKIELLANLMTILVITIGGIFVIGEEITIGTLVAVNSYGIMLAWPMKELGWLTNVMAQAAASVKKVTELLDKTPEVKPALLPEAPAVTAGQVSFKNVSFRRNDREILREINFDVPAGKTVAVMGHTGSGKTSIINLLCRFYDCNDGSISIDGVDVKNWDTDALRKNIALVMQDVFLFSDSIKENIYFGHDTDIVPEKDLPWERMRGASRDAQSHSFISSLPDGYDTIIGERGIGLSGGQKQRISIARALLKDAKILVLDDATSALDMETEFEIQKAIQERTDLTKFIIAHRISAVKDADEIIILEKGRIAERGTHKFLLQQKGLYYETFVEQYGELGLQVQQQ